MRVRTWRSGELMSCAYVGHSRCSVSRSSSTSLSPPTVSSVPSTPACAHQLSGPNPPILEYMWYPGYQASYRTFALAHACIWPCHSGQKLGRESSRCTQAHAQPALAESTQWHGLSQVVARLKPCSASDIEAENRASHRWRRGRRHWRGGSRRSGWWRRRPCAQAQTWPRTHLPAAPRGSALAAPGCPSPWRPDSGPHMNRRVTLVRSRPPSPNQSEVELLACTPLSLEHCFAGSQARARFFSGFREHWAWCITECVKE